jgi:hypothetical protein
VGQLRIIQFNFSLGYTLRAFSGEYAALLNQEKTGRGVLSHFRPHFRARRTVKERPLSNPEAHLAYIWRLSLLAPYYSLTRF